MNKELDLRTVLLALSVIFIWGFSFVAIKIALDYISPGHLVLFRFLPVLFFFVPALIINRNISLKSLSWRKIIILFVLGFFAVEIYNISLFTGQTYLPAQMAALVIALNPASIAIVSSIVIKERPGISTWIGILISMAGIATVVLSRGETEELRIQHVIGVLITLGAPLSWGIYSTGLRHFSQGLGAINATSLSMSLGTLPLIFVAIFDSSFHTAVLTAPPKLWIAALFLAIPCTVYGFTGWAIVLKRTPAAKAGAFIYLVPLIAALGGRWMLDEPIDLAFIAGATLVIFGVWVATGRKNPFRRQPKRASL
ncbi:DMT family transporter [bacterium]|nr:DMT family transporter [bacterium]